MRKNLEAGNLSFVAVRTLGTPRRLTIIVEGVAEKQADASVEAKGPAKKAAFDAEGKPTKALLGFARSRGVDVKDLKTVETDKGEYLFAVKKVKGEETKKILPAMLASIVSSIGFPKSMRWGAHSITYARPVHWILALYGTDTVKFEFGHVTSGNTTYGHRFVGGPKGAKGSKAGKARSRGAGPRALKITGVAEYLDALKGSGVIADPAERKRIIADAIEEAAHGVKGGGGGRGRVLEDPALLDEVTNLVEYPVVLVGSFDREFLELPKDVVINAMREHQRYFSVVDNSAGLLPHFITVANTEVPDPAVVVKGNERVLKARLNDAKFYFEKDRTAGLAGMVEELKGVVFQAKLGTSYEKVVRFAELALFIGKNLGWSDKLDASEGVEDFLSEKYDPARYKKVESDPCHYNKLILGRAAMLAKADLVSGVVGEFPKLQGVMGMEYARLSGEVDGVSRALLEHYRPVRPKGPALL
jgi:glycyl-tRNA synthetase beta chain